MTIAARRLRVAAARARRSAELFDGYRVDHLVGFFRTYCGDADGDAAFMPEHEPEQIRTGGSGAQRAQRAGRARHRRRSRCDSRFVRETLNRMDIPGYKVMRWERDWDEDGKPFRIPHLSRLQRRDQRHARYRPVAEWWDEAPSPSAEALARSITTARRIRSPEPFNDTTRDAILQLLYRAGSDIVLLPIQDVFGWKERINTPRSSMTRTGPGGCAGWSRSW